MRVENWQQGDDVTAIRWHEQDCKMMLGQDSGNVLMSKKILIAKGSCAHYYMDSSRLIFLT